MNLQSKKARIPIAALGVTALCTAGLGVLATSASAAPTALGLNSGGTAPVVGNFGHASNATASTAYALKVLGSDQSTNRVLLESSPTTAATLYYSNVTGNGAATAAGTWIPLDRDSGTVTPTNVSASATGAAVPDSNNLYVQGDVPGTYTFRVFQDTNDSDTYDSADERSTALITMTVLDTSNSTATTADDVAPVVSAPSPTTPGDTFTPTITYSKSLSTSDGRGNSATGLAASLAAVTFTNVNSGTAIDGTGATITGAADTVNDAAAVYSTSTEKTSFPAALTPANAGYVLLGADFVNSAPRATTSYSSDTKTVTVESNHVTDLTLDATDVVGSVLEDSGSVYVKTGTSAVTYTAKAIDDKGTGTTADDVPVSDATVTFTLTSGTHSPSFTTDGTTVDAVAKKYSAKTNSSGVASLKVTSTVTTDGTDYSVDAESNAQSASSLSAYYQDAAADDVIAGNISAVVGGSATLSGKVVDQWDQPYHPTGVTAELTITTDAAPTGTTPATGNFPIASDGTFSAVVSEPSSNTTPNVDTFRWDVDGQAVSGLKLSWQLSITPGVLDVTQITTNGATQTVPYPSGATVKENISSAGSQNFEYFQGTLKDNSTTPQPLQYASVTYSGSDGVYFYDDANDKLLKTLTARTNSSGQLSYDESSNQVYVLFTKTGDATITAVAGSATEAFTVPVEASSDPYQVIAQDAKSKPGQTISLLGKVLDAFGNPVPSTDVTLALASASAGTLSGTDADTGTTGFQVTTDATGVWSTPFTSTSNQDGNVVLTATLTGQTTNALPDSLYADRGVTIPHGEYQDTAAIQVVDPTTGIAVTGSLIGGGKAQISGTAEAGASVDLYQRRAGETGFVLVKSLNADATGMWGIGTTLTKTTSFFARSGGKTSDTVTTIVYSYQTVKAKALGEGKVRFTVYGTPNVKGVVNIYIGSKRLAHVATDSHGDVVTVVQSKAGRRTFKIYFVAPGTSLKGTSLTGTVS